MRGGGAALFQVENRPPDRVRAAATPLLESLGIPFVDEPVESPLSASRPATASRPDTLIATFGPTTAWHGRSIGFDGRLFILEGFGPITPQAVLEYEREGHLVWATDATRQWVAAIAREGDGGVAS
jgi:hypothetical protein